jgi:hypothetical protein
VSTGVLTPLQLNAGAGLLQNQGLGVNAELTATIATYNNSAVIEPLLSTIVIGSAGNVGNTILSNATIASLQTLASNTCPALSDSVPAGYPSIVVSTSPPGFTGVLTTTAATYTGNGDVSKFVQAISIAQGYAVQTNLFVNSAVNSQTYLGNTFTTTNDMITGDVTSINLATQPFGSDLEKLDDDKLVKLLKLEESSTEIFSTLDEFGKLKIFENTSDIIKYFVNFRLTYYHKRKEFMLDKMNRDLKILGNRGRFIKAILDGKLKVNNVAKAQIIEGIEEMGLDKIDDSYDYLLRMPIYSLTKEVFDKLKEDFSAKKEEIKALEATDPKDMYVQDLTELKKKFK